MVGERGEKCGMQDVLHVFFSKVLHTPSSDGDTRENG